MVTQPKLTARNLEKQEAAKNRKRLTFEVSAKQVLVYFTIFLVCLSWMFAFGVLVGRGLPHVSSEDISIRAQVLRFLGLEGGETPQPVEKASETWVSPQKMAEALNYYEDLTQRNPQLPFKNTAPVTPTPALNRDAQTDAANKQAKAIPAPLAPQEYSAAPAQADSADKTGVAKTTLPAAQDGPAAENPSEHFTLLVASLKDLENAQRLVDQLKTKGYAPRLQLLDLNGGGHWNRVLVGSFKTRELALKFAAEFNKKERMEGLVIRESY